jgi:hypothetical protein
MTIETITPQDFQELNDSADVITEQNKAYDAAGAKNPKFAYVPKNELAKEQADHKELLSAMADDLPYEELAIEYMQAEQEIANILDELEIIETEPTPEKIGATALANKIMTELMPAYDPATVAANLARRIREINNQRSGELLQKLNILEGGLAELQEFYDIAGQAWPIARANHIVVEEPVIPRQPGTNGHKPKAKMDTEAIIPAETAGEQPEEEAGPPIEARLQEFKLRHVDQPEASQWIVFYLIENAGQWLTPAQIAGFVYHRENQQLKGVTPAKDRILTLLGPKIQGKRNQRILLEEGYRLQYGWRAKEAKDSLGRSSRVKTRKYRALAIDGVTVTKDGDLPVDLEYLKG